MMKINELVEKYIALRDRRAERKASYDKDDSLDVAMQEKIEAVLLKHFNETGAESVKTAYGTAYKSSRTSATVADRDVFFTYVIEHKAYELLESRCNKTAVAQHKAANNDLPPGINWREELTINVRRA
jgi:hypothetical protein